MVVYLLLEYTHTCRVYGLGNSMQLFWCYFVTSAGNESFNCLSLPLVLNAHLFLVWHSECNLNNKWLYQSYISSHFFTPKFKSLPSSKQAQDSEKLAFLQKNKFWIYKNTLVFLLIRVIFLDKNKNVEHSNNRWKEEEKKCLGLI